MWYHMQAYCVWNQNADHKCIGLLTFPSILYECINQASFFIVFVLFQPQSKLVPFPGHSDRQYWLLTICTRWTEGGGGAWPQQCISPMHFMCTVYHDQWHSQDTEVAWAQGLYAVTRSEEKKFCLHFSVTKMGSCGTFVLCTASNPCLLRLAGEPGTMQNWLFSCWHCCMHPQQNLVI